VAELGAGGVGSIRYLAEMIEPDIGVLLKVGLAHVGEFGGIETTAKIKGELLDVMNEQAASGRANLLIANADDDSVRALVAAHPRLNVQWFGTSNSADYVGNFTGLSLKGTGLN